MHRLIHFRNLRRCSGPLGPLLQAVGCQPQWSYPTGAAEISCHGVSLVSQTLEAGHQKRWCHTGSNTSHVQRGPTHVDVPVGSTSMRLEVGSMATLTDGACTVRMGNTVVLATVVTTPQVDDAADFLPLQVDYQERAYAAGRLPGNLQRRERSTSDWEVLCARAIDRALRPLFPPGFYYETHVHALVLSADGVHDPEVAAINAASAALMVSDIPWGGPVGAVRVGRVDGKLVVNPPVKKAPGQGEATSDLNLTLAVCDGKVVMLEMQGAEVPEEVVAEAMQLAQRETAAICAAQRQLAAAAGRAKRTVRLAGADPDAEEWVRGLVEPLLLPALRQGAALNKQQRSEAVEEVKRSAWAQLQQLQEEAEQEPAAAAGGAAGGSADAAAAAVPDLSYAQYSHAFENVLSQLMRQLIIDEGLRVDGRRLMDVRQITCGVGALPAQVHGSALFQRGETQVLAAATVGCETDVMKVESLGHGSQEKRFFLHYNFPPFAVNEAGKVSAPGRREVGHGSLAERALAPVMPHEEHFPFPVRLVVETLASNGSSSMAAVCGGSLALRHAGVPVSDVVAGISVGLATEHFPRPQGGTAGGSTPGQTGWNWPQDYGRHALFADIQGVEDHLGDMDFKVAGTTWGITAMQLDTKLPGVPLEMLTAALAPAQEVRRRILDTMNAALAADAQQRQAAVAGGAQAPGGAGDAAGVHDPQLEVTLINKDYVKSLLGESRETITALQENTGARLIVNEAGQIHVYAPTRAQLDSALAAVRAIEGTDMVEGQVYTAKVAVVLDVGVFLEMSNGTRHFLHISEASAAKVRSMQDVLAEGQVVEVMCMGRDMRGLVKLSRKPLLLQQQQQQEQQQQVQ